MVLLGFLILFCMSAWVYSNAKDRGCTYCALWALSILIFPVVFLPLYLICRPAKRHYYFDNVPSRQVCPRCGKYYDDSFIRCPYCGEDAPILVPRYDPDNPNNFRR